MNNPRQAAASFPLNGFGDYLQQMNAPDSPFNPGGAWTHRYQMFSLAGRGSANGEVTLRRKPVGQQAKLYLHCKKSTSDRPALIEEAEITIQSDPLSTPRQWTLATRTELQPGQVMPETLLRQQARCDRDGLRIETGRGRRQHPVRGPFTVNWALFDAVQRLPRRAGFETEVFTLFDHFDQRKEAQQIKYWTETDSPAAGGKTVRLHGFEQTGRGILPIYYWVSETGRLTAVISGIEGYLLDTVKGGQTR